MCLRFGSSKPQLDGFTDSDMSADVDTSRSTFGYVMTYGGGAVSWQSRLQKTVALSTTEAEYMAAVEAGKEVLWMKDLIGEFGIRQEEYRLYCDSKSAIHLAKNAVVASVFPRHCISSHIVIVYSLWAVVVFPTIVGFPRYILC